MRRTPPSFQPGPLNRAQAEALNQLARDLYNSLLDHFTAVPPLECQQDAGGVRYRLSGSSTTSGIEFKELDGSPDLTAITTVIVDNGTLSTSGAGIARITNGGIGAREVDTAPSYTGITLISFDQGDGFVLTQPVAGEVRVDITVASASTVGIISLADQYLGSGIKTVDKLRVNTISAFPVSTSPVIYSAGSIHATPGNLYTGDPTKANVLGSLVAATNNVQLGAQLLLHDLFLSLDASTRVCNLNSTTDVAQPAYACRGTTGVSGTGGGGDTFTGGIATALGAAGFTGTAVLAKLTTTGAAGSLTFVSGKCTAYVAPT